MIGTVNLALPDCSKILSEKHFTLRWGGKGTKKDAETHEELETLRREEFCIIMHIPRNKPI